MKLSLAVLALVCLVGCDIPKEKMYFVNLKSGGHYAMCGVTRITKDSCLYHFYDGMEQIGLCNVDIVESIEEPKQDNEIPVEVQ